MLHRSNNGAWITGCSEHCGQWSQVSQSVRVYPTVTIGGGVGARVAGCFGYASRSLGWELSRPLRVCARFWLFSSLLGEPDHSVNLFFCERTKLLTNLHCAGTDRQGTKMVWFQYHFGRHDSPLRGARLVHLQPQVVYPSFWSNHIHWWHNYQRVHVCQRLQVLLHEWHHQGSAVCVPRRIRCALQHRRGLSVSLHEGSS